MRMSSMINQLLKNMPFFSLQKVLDCFHTFTLATRTLSIVKHNPIFYVAESAMQQFSYVGDENVALGISELLLLLLPGVPSSVNRSEQRTFTPKIVKLCIKWLSLKV